MLRFEFIHHGLDLKEEEERRKLHQIRQADEQREHREDKAEAAEMSMLEGAVADQQQMKARFERRIQTYQTATIGALQDNEVSLQESLERLRQILSNAFMLPNGRRVFKSEDGVRVFDEHGELVGPDEVDPNAIDDELTSWEEFQRELELGEQLQQERQELLEYQDRLDRIEDKTASGDLSPEQTHDLEMQLDLDMPASVQQRLGLASPSSPTLTSGVSGANRATGLADPSPVSGL